MPVIRYMCKNSTKKTNRKKGTFLFIASFLLIKVIYRNNTGDHIGGKRKKKKKVIKLLLELGRECVCQMGVGVDVCIPS